jgi:hypothetical protein
MAESVPDATNRKAVLLVVVGVLVHAVDVVDHAPTIRAAGIYLRGRPPVAVVAGIVEIAIGATVAARQC